LVFHDPAASPPAGTKIFPLSPATFPKVVASSTHNRLDSREVFTVNHRFPLAFRLLRCSALLFAALPVTTLLLAAGDCADAQTLQTSSLPSSKPLSPEAAGDVLFAHGEFVEAIDAYSHAPADAATLNKIGVAWHHLSAVDEAKRNYEQALSLRPNFPEALNNLGAALFTQKKYNQAIRLYRRALKLSPDSAVITANLGTAYFAQGKSGPGIEEYRTAISMDPSVFDLDSLQIIGGPVRDRDRAEQNYCLAEIFAEMNADERALQFLHKAFDEGFKDMKRLTEDHAFDNLRTTADFAELMGEVSSTKK
jgi:tetratricopeptide (TPR) repeat protein